MPDQHQADALARETYTFTLRHAAHALSVVWTAHAGPFDELVAEAREVAATSLQTGRRRMARAWLATLGALEAGTGPAPELHADHAWVLRGASDGFAAKWRTGPFSAVEADVRRAAQEAWRGQVAVARAAAWLETLAALVRRGRTVPPPPSSRDLVREAVRRNARVGVASVPIVVRGLRPELRPGEVHAELAALEREGEIELRPARGMLLLRPEDAALCPAGRDGEPLSLARRIA